MSVHRRPTTRKHDTPKWEETAPGWQDDPTALVPESLLRWKDGDVTRHPVRLPIVDRNAPTPFDDLDMRDPEREPPANQFNDARELAQYYQLAVETLRSHGHEPGGEPVQVVTCPRTCVTAIKLIQALDIAEQMARGGAEGSRVTEWQIHRSLGWVACELTILLHGAEKARYGRKSQVDLQNGQEEGRRKQANEAQARHEEYRAHYDDLITQGRQHTVAVQTTAKRFNVSDKTIRRALARHQK